MRHHELRSFVQVLVPYIPLYVCVVLALVTACLIELSRKWRCSFVSVLRSQPAEEALELPLELSLSLSTVAGCAWQTRRAVRPRQCALWSEVRSSTATTTSRTSSFSRMKGSVSRILTTRRHNPRLTLVGRQGQEEVWLAQLLHHLHCLRSLQTKK